MSALGFLRTTTTLALCVALGGCFVSEAPLLTAANGAATPLAPGDYLACSQDDPDEEPNCPLAVVSINFAGLYRMDADGDDPVLMRMRRIAPNGYVVQIREDDDEHAFYYGDNRGAHFRLTFMMCTDLQEKLRERLVAAGDIVIEDGDIPICIAQSVNAVEAAARAYHRGEVAPGEDRLFQIEFKPVAENAP